MGRPRSTAAGGAAPALSATPCAAHCSCRSRPQPLWPRKTPTTCRSGSAAAGGAAPSSRACLQTRLPTWRRAARPTCRRALLRRILLHRSAVPGSAPRCGWLRCRRRCGALRVARAAEVSARRPSPACSRCCATQVWAKVLPLGLIFFVASFNLTILQASLPHACGPCVHAAGRGRRGAAAASAGAAVLLSSPACPPSCMRRFHHPCPAEPPARHHGDRPLLHPRIQLSHCWPPLAPCPAEPQGRHHGDDGGRGDAAILASCVVLPASLAFFMLYGRMVEALPSVRRCLGAGSSLAGAWVGWLGRHGRAVEAPPARKAVPCRSAPLSAEVRVLRGAVPPGRLLRAVHRGALPHARQPAPQRLLRRHRGTGAPGLARPAQGCAAAAALCPC